MKLIRKIICSFIGCRSVMIYKKVWNERDPYEIGNIVTYETESILYRCERCGEGS